MKKLLTIIVLSLLLSGSGNANAETYYSTTCNANDYGSLKDPITFKFKKIKSGAWMAENREQEGKFYFSLAQNTKGKNVETLLWYQADLSKKILLNFWYDVEREIIRGDMLKLNQKMIDDLLKNAEGKYPVEIDYLKLVLMDDNKSKIENIGTFRNCKGSVQGAKF
jgi:hypothetical protein